MTDEGGIPFELDGRPLRARPGQSVAAALIANGVLSWRTTRVTGRPRGAFCGIGVCYDCLVSVEGREPERGCLVPIEEDMRLASPATEEAATEERATEDPEGEA